jgi:hypothetical protein
VYGMMRLYAIARCAAASMILTGVAEGGCPVPLRQVDT